MAAIRSRQQENEALARAIGQETIVALVRMLNEGGVQVERVDDGTPDG